MPLDRVVGLIVPVRPGVSGGLTGGVASFRILQEAAPQVRLVGSTPVNDTYLIAFDPQGAPVAARGTWLSGSIIRFTGHTVELQRPLTWNASTVSLATGKAYRRGASSTEEVYAPYITDPAWWALVATTGTALTDATVIVDVSGVLLINPSSLRKVWCEVTAEQYDETEATVGSRTVPRIIGTSEWMFRRNAGVVPFTTIVDGSTYWRVTGVRDSGGRARSSFVAVDATREFFGVG